VSRAESPRSILEKVFYGTRSPLSQQGLETLCAYLDLLFEWSQRINLTGFKDVPSAAEGLLYDAVEIAPFVPQHAVVLDVGAGAGGLSVALSALRPDIALRLVEPRTKRMAFLRAVVRELSLSARVEVINERAENLPSELTSGLDVAYAQAVMPPSRWLELARGLVKDAGLVLCLTSKTLAELDVTIPASLTSKSERCYHLPLSGTPRVVTAFLKRPMA
jgi:16S rRNA (guanine527-N7)-methyltransferase